MSKHTNKESQLCHRWEWARCQWLETSREWVRHQRWDAGQKVGAHLAPHQALQLEMGWSGHVRGAHYCWKQARTGTLSVTENEQEQALSMLGHRMKGRCSPGTLLGVAAGNGQERVPFGVAAGNGWVQVPLSVLGLGCRMAGRASRCVRLHEGKGEGGWERAIERGKNGTGCVRARAGCARVVEQGKNGTGCTRVRAGGVRARVAVRVWGKGWLCKCEGSWERAVVLAAWWWLVSKMWSSSRLVAEPMKAGSYFWLQLGSQFARLSSKLA